MNIGWYHAVLTEPFPGQRGGYFDLARGTGPGIALDEDALRRQPAQPIDVSGDYRHRYAFASRQGGHWV